ncbi:MAG: hypothetical protein ACOXZ2_05980 [Sphaerochaetaceae bacterium]
MQNSSLRRAWYAGSWYADDEKSLRATVIESMEEANRVRSKESPSGPIRFALPIPSSKEQWV